MAGEFLSPLVAISSLKVCQVCVQHFEASELGQWSASSAEATPRYGMVWPIVISLFVTPGALRFAAASAAPEHPMAKMTAAPAAAATPVAQRVLHLLFARR
ncbi:MAG TPA: hypothetical protein VJ747_17385 [Stellaceae bacterium]|nr:hypothetical protein [Stellaceae bacterium]